MDFEPNALVFGVNAGKHSAYDSRGPGVNGLVVNLSLRLIELLLLEMPIDLSISEYEVLLQLYILNTIKHYRNFILDRLNKDRLGPLSTLASVLHPELHRILRVRPASLRAFKVLLHDILKVETHHLCH